MALTVEDGTGVEGADSFVTIAELKTYAGSRGITLPTADADIEKLLVKAKDYLESEVQGKYKGYRTFPKLTTLKWPRTGVEIDGYYLPSTEIPLQLKQAQMQLAIELQTVDPTPTLSGNQIKREKVDVLETEYAIDYKSGQKPPVLTKVSFLLRPLLRNVGGIRVTRV